MSGAAHEEDLWQVAASRRKQLVEFLALQQVETETRSVCCLPVSEFKPIVGFPGTPVCCVCRDAVSEFRLWMFREQQLRFDEFVTLARWAVETDGLLLITFLQRESDRILLDVLKMPPQSLLARSAAPADAELGELEKLFQQKLHREFEVEKVRPFTCIQSFARRSLAVLRSHPSVEIDVVLRDDCQDVEEALVECADRVKEVFGDPLGWRTFVLTIDGANAMVRVRGFDPQGSMEACLCEWQEMVAKIFLDADPRKNFPHHELATLMLSEAEHYGRSISHWSDAYAVVGCVLDAVAVKLIGLFEKEPAVNVPALGIADRVKALFALQFGTSIDVQSALSDWRGRPSVGEEIMTMLKNLHAGKQTLGDVRNQLRKPVRESTKSAKPRSRRPYAVTSSRPNVLPTTKTRRQYVTSASANVLPTTKSLRSSSSKQGDRRAEKSPRYD